MRGLGRENGGWVIGGRAEERGRMASDENKEEFWCVSESKLNAGAMDKERGGRHIEGWCLANA